MASIHSALVSGNDLTAEEQRWLDEHNEPKSRLSILDDVEGISQGRQSRVSVLAYGAGDALQRVIWKRMGAGKGLAFDEAIDMRSSLEPYRESLLKFGWRVPAIYYHDVVDLSEETQIFSYEQFIAGGDGDSLLSDPTAPTFRKWHLIQEVFRTLYRYPAESLHRRVVAGREVTCLPHGLDLKAANIVLEERTNQLYFIDLFAPKLLDIDGQIQGYTTKIDSLPEEHLRAVCATREGCVLRFWRLARRLWEREFARRGDLTDDLLVILKAMGCPSEELATIEDEIRSGFLWLKQLYDEPLV